MHINGLIYSVASTVKAYTYEDGVLVDSADSPFDFTLPSTNSSGKYKLIGADSIYFPEGSIISLSGSTTQSEPAGGKLSLNGNKLTITQHIYQDTVENISGVDYHLIETGTAAISLQKQ